MAVAADLLWNLRNLNGQIVIGVVEAGEQFRDYALVVGNKLALHLPFRAVAEDVEGRAAQALERRAPAK